VRETYGIDLAARYLGVDLPHPIGKGSGQLSLNGAQLEDDAAAGLACAVLKTVIAEDESGVQAMAAWAIHEPRMQVERRAAAGERPGGRTGWTVTWKGRGWDRSLADYLALVRTGRDLGRATGMLVVPSVKYHLPRLAEAFRDGEYRHTTRRLAAAWGEPGFTHPTPLALAALAYQAVIVAFVSYLIWFWLLQRYPASGLTSFSFWTPLFGVLAGWLLLGERLTGHLGAAAALVAAGIYLVNRRA